MQVKRRRGNVQQNFSARADQVLDRVDAIKAPIPKMLIVPGVFADREGHRLAIDADDLLMIGGREVPHLVEDIVAGQQPLRLQEIDLAVAQ